LIFFFIIIFFFLSFCPLSSVHIYIFLSFSVLYLFFCSASAWRPPFCGMPFRGINMSQTQWYERTPGVTKVCSHHLAFVPHWDTLGHWHTESSRQSQHPNKCTVWSKLTFIFIFPLVIHWFIELTRCAPRRLHHENEVCDYHESTNVVAGTCGHPWPLVVKNCSTNCSFLVGSNVQHFIWFSPLKLLTSKCWIVVHSV